MNQTKSSPGMPLIGAPGLFNGYVDCGLCKARKPLEGII